jgi:protein-L-isoaspartate(D-aspartate) O-methyltransferase
MQNINPDEKYTARREAMVQNQLVGRGIRDQLVLKAMRKVPRERFVPEMERDFAYTDGPLPIGAGQTISQPFIVALMTEALQLKGGERVLEIGTGSGYAAAILAEIAGEVFTVERVKELADRAADTLRDQGYVNAHVRHGDGTLGWAERAPYDAIVVTAGGPKVPESLRQQLTVGGRLVMPVGINPQFQSLVQVVRISDDRFDSTDLGAVRFVALVGKEGWRESDAGL